MNSASTIIERNRLYTLVCTVTGMTYSQGLNNKQCCYIRLGTFLRGSFFGFLGFAVAFPLGSFLGFARLRCLRLICLWHGCLWFLAFLVLTASFFPRQKLPAAPVPLFEPSSVCGSLSSDPIAEQASDVLSPCAYNTNLFSNIGRSEMSHLEC